MRRTHCAPSVRPERPNDKNSRKIKTLSDIPIAKVVPTFAEHALAELAAPCNKFTKIALPGQMGMAPEIEKP